MWHYDYRGAAEATHAPCSSSTDTWVAQGTALPSQNSSQMPNRSPSKAGLWQRASSICLPSLCNTEYHRWTRGEDTEVALVLQSTCSSPLEISDNWIDFCHWLDKCCASRTSKNSMAVVTQLQQHIESKAELTYKYVILFYISISVINCRKSGL